MAKSLFALRSSERIVHVDIVRGVAITGWAFAMLADLSVKLSGDSFVLLLRLAFVHLVAIVFGLSAALFLERENGSIVFLRRLFCLALLFFLHTLCFSFGFGLGLCMSGVLLILFRGTSLNFLTRLVTIMFFMHVMCAVIDAHFTKGTIPLVASLSSTTFSLVVLGYWAKVSGFFASLCSRFSFCKKYFYLFVGSWIVLSVFSQSFASSHWLFWQSLAFALMVLCGLFMLMHHAQWLSCAILFAPAGRMPLSAGLLMSMAMVSVVTFSFSPVVRILLGMVLLLISTILCQWWLARYAYGPCEWLVRAVMRGAFIPMRMHEQPPAHNVHEHAK